MVHKQKMGALDLGHQKGNNGKMKKKSLFFLVKKKLSCPSPSFHRGLRCERQWAWASPLHVTIERYRKLWEIVHEKQKSNFIDHYNPQAFAISRGVKKLVYFGFRVK